MNKTQKIAVVKTALRVTASLGAGTIVYTLVRNNVVPANAIQKITIPVATFALSGAVASVAGNQWESLVDDVVDFLDDPKKVKIAVVNS